MGVWTGTIIYLHLLELEEIFLILDLQQSCLCIQSIVLNKYAPKSSSGFPDNSGLNYDQLMALGADSNGCGGNGGIEGTTGHCGGFVVISPSCLSRLLFHVVEVVVMVLLSDPLWCHLVEYIPSVC